MTTSSFISVWLAQMFKPLQMFPAKYFPRIKIQQQTPWQTNYEVFFLQVFDNYYCIKKAIIL